LLILDFGLSPGDLLNPLNCGDSDSIIQLI